MASFEEIMQRYGTDAQPTAPDTRTAPMAVDPGFASVITRYTDQLPPPIPPAPVPVPKKPRDVLKAIEESAKGVDTAFKAVPQGVKEVVLSALRGADYVNDKVPLLKTLDRATGLTPSKDNIQRLIDESKAFEVSPEGASSAGQFGRIVGQQLMATPLTLGPLAALRAGGAAIGPNAGATANWLTGGGGAVSNALGGAELGAANNALTYGARETPLAEHVGEGAMMGGLTGGAMYAAPKISENILNATRAGINSLTEGGQQRIANSLIEQHAGGPLALNTTQYVPGSSPTMAEAAENVGISRLQNAFRDHKELGSSIVNKETENQGLRRDFLVSGAGTPADIAAAQTARATNEGPAISHVFAAPGTADALPVIQQIDSILAGPGGKRPAVKSALDDVKKLLVSDGPAGTKILESDPEILYRSVRNHIRDMLDRRLNPNSNNAALAASAELGQVKNALDDAIESGAPGFKQAISDYADASRPISAQQYLQGLNLTDAAGNLTLNKVKNAIEKTDKLRLAPGVNGAKSLSNDDLQLLNSLHDDLSREGNKSLGRGYGSNTTQNLLAQAALPGNSLLARVANPEVAGSLVGNAIGAGVGHWLGGEPWIGAALGAVPGAMVGHALRGGLSAQNSALQQKILDRLIDPTLYARAPAPIALTANGGNQLMIPAAAGATASSLSR